MLATSIIFSPLSNSRVTASCRRSWNRRLQNSLPSGMRRAVCSARYAARARWTARLKDTVTACGVMSNTLPELGVVTVLRRVKSVFVAVVDSGTVRESPFLVSGSSRVRWRKSMFAQSISVTSDSRMPVAKASVTMAGSDSDSVKRIMPCTSSWETRRSRPRGADGRLMRRTGLLRWSNPHSRIACW